PDIFASNHFGYPAPGQSVRPTRADAARSDHRQHFAHSHLDASERSAFGPRRDGALGRRVSERPLRFRWALAAAGPSSGVAISKITRRNLCSRLPLSLEARDRVATARPWLNGFTKSRKSAATLNSNSSTSRISTCRDWPSQCRQ